jgi:Domain of unknown function (DUF4082)/Bacterial Ig-like domain/Bacterial Ig domain
MYTRTRNGLRATVIVAGLVSLLFGTVAMGVNPVRTWVPLMGVATTAKSGDAVNPAAIKAGPKNPRVMDFAEDKLAANVNSPAIAAVEPTCPCSAWPSATIPANASVADPNPVELGVKFRMDVAGFITGVRFYKGSANSGTHVGNLWTSAGQLLASATFTNETASGWQQVNFAAPVAIAANTIYVASYFAPNGNYAGDNFFFTAAGVDNGVVHLLQDGVSGGNGVYIYGPSSAFPSSTFRASNYWVDVVFTTASGPDTTPPTVAAMSPANGATGVSATTVVTATFGEAMNATTINTSTFELRNAGNVLVPATVTYDAGSFTATLTPSSSLAAPATYTVTVKGGATDPRVKDAADNALAASVTGSFTTAVDPCAAAPNLIVAENCRPGNPASEWDVSGAGDLSIQGFATQISVNRSETVFFKVDTTAAGYRFDIYRLGYYGGLGARKVATVQPSAALPQTQPNCLTDAATGLVDCGNWAVSGSWVVPTNAVSGIYFAKLVRADTGGASHVVFIVRDDAGTSDLLFRTSDTTWQAYNDYGGNSLYVGSPIGRAFKVSYNRPFNTRGNQFSRAWLFGAEYPMVRWIESNGYNVSYFAGVDTDRFGALIRTHKVFLSVGHDEYWSKGERDNVEAARNAGVHLAFFSGDEVFWKTRWEASIDGSGTPRRTLVSYKETHANAVIDPQDPPTWTGTWRDARFSPPADGGRPENALTGTIFTVNCCDASSPGIKVPSEFGGLRFWRNTSIAALSASQIASLPLGTLGYEWDEDLDNGHRPAGLIRLSSTTVNGALRLIDNGSNFASGVATHSLTMYRHSSGALVFGAGTIRWSWGLDGNHDFDSATPNASLTPDIRMQQATVNLFADMGVQAAALRLGLVQSSASTDAAAPRSVITVPANGASVQQGTAVTISGTTTDTGGGVIGGIEVSVDGGITWHPANGRATWTFNWTPAALGNVTIKARAIDDSGNIEVPGLGTTVTVGAQACPCSGWNNSIIPAIASVADTGAVELGVKFRADASGFITGIRFYKGSANTGTHIGNLWSSTGTRLATATFTGETASGWQQVNFAAPVAINANTVYVASYHAPNGRYAADNFYFANGGVDSGVLHFLQDGVSGGNGVFTYSASSSFPTSTFQATNYWVDVMFATGAADPTPPAVPTGITATATTSGAAVSWNANTDTDLAGYYIYRGASVAGQYTRLNLDLLSGPSYEDTLAPSGTSFYAVSAVDATGNESGRSGVVSVSMASSNRLLNPGFELDANNNTRPDNWTADTRVTRSNLLARSGTFAMRHFATTNPSYTLTQVVTGLNAATTYTFAGWTNVPSTADAFTFTLRIRWRNAANAILRTDNIKSYVAATSGWDKASASLLAPIGTTNAQVQMVVSSLNATIYVDDFALR